jgi:hypothetical protein
MHIVNPSVLPLFHELSREIVGKLAPDVPPDESDPLYKFTQQINTMTEALVDKIASSFTMLNAPINEGTEIRSEKETIFSPKAVALLREMWRLMNKSQP